MKTVLKVIPQMGSTIFLTNKAQATNIVLAIVIADNYNFNICNSIETSPEF